MRAGRFGKGAIVTTVIGVALAAGDYSDVADRIARALGIPVDWLPLIYIGLFGLALWLMRMEYESADYDFVFDPAMEYLYEPGLDGGAEIHRVSVLNHGNSQITGQVRLMAIDPQPREFWGKIGMPLVPVGTHDDTDGTFTVHPGVNQPVNLVSYHYGSRLLMLWHPWTDAPREIGEDGPHVRFTFSLEITTTEGKPKPARFVLNRVADMSPDGRIYQLTQVDEPTRCARLIRLLSGAT